VLSEYTPMAPTQVREAFHREGWVYEEKIDGWRLRGLRSRGVVINRSKARGASLLRQISRFRLRLLEPVGHFAAGAPGEAGGVGGINGTRSERSITRSPASLSATRRSEDSSTSFAAAARSRSTASPDRANDVGN
jgi:hypothetical protein